MTIINRGSVFEYDDASPSTTVSGSKDTAAHCWRYCPYSTQSTNYNSDSRVPEIEKTYHPETQGQLHSWSVGGAMGWTCADNACSYFLGTATTEVEQAGRRFQTTSGTGCEASDLPTLSGSVEHLTQGRRIVSGTRYYEI